MSDEKNRQNERSKENKNDKGDDEMNTTEIKRKDIRSQSETFLNLRQKFQSQMKKKNISYEDVKRKTKEIRRGE